MKKDFSRWLLIVLVALSIAACAPLIAPYDQQAVAQTQALKSDTLALMAKSTQPYAKHKQQAEKVSQQLDALYSNVQQTDKNTLVTQQIALVKDPKGNLLGGFLRRWQDKNTLNLVYVKQKQAQIARAFDAILKLEMNKPSGFG